MMKRFILLFALLMVVFLQLQQREQDHESQQSYFLDNDEKALINAPQEIQLSIEGQSFSLHQKQGLWRLKEKNDYMANQQHIRQWLMALHDAKILETKTKNPKLYEKLGVQPIKRGGRQVMIKSNDHDMSLIIGKPYMLGEKATYIRKAHEKASYLVSGDLYFSDDLLDWLDRRILHLPEEKVHRIRVKHPKLDYSLIQKQPGEVIFHFETLTDESKLKDTTKHLELVFLFNQLLFQDVRPTLKEVNADIVHDIVVECFDGMTVNLTLFQDGNDYWLKPTAEYHPDLAKRFSHKDGLSVKNQVSLLKEQWNGWFYQIPQKQGEILARSFDDYLR